MMDPRTPVIVGAAQLLNRSNDYAEPVAMMSSVARSALNNASPNMAAQLQEVGVVNTQS